MYLSLFFFFLSIRLISMHSFMLLLVLVTGMGTEMPLQAAGDQHLIVKILEMGNVIAPLSAIARRHASCLALGRKKKKKERESPLTSQVLSPSYHSVKCGWLMNERVNHVGKGCTQGLAASHGICGVSHFSDSPLSDCSQSPC